jgi:DUF1680 family protein
MVRSTRCLLNVYRKWGVVRPTLVQVARTLLSWTGAVKYADFLERVLHNGILGTQRGYVPGVMLYNLPLGAGVSKAGKQHWRSTGWGEPFESFWCCYGTLVESFAKLGDSLAFEGTDDAWGEPPTLYMVQYTSAKIQWKAAGEQEAHRRYISLVSHYTDGTA